MIQECYKWCAEGNGGPYPNMCIGIRTQTSTEENHANTEDSCVVAKARGFRRNQRRLLGSGAEKTFLLKPLSRWPWHTNMYPKSS